ncbi:MAG: DUF5368 domain-containing protein [Burkholderiaceae bacterium]|nr:DUF5368 domain-containing protein [Burkholderiaceae bacterium]
MKDYDPWVFLAVFQEMLGIWLWIGLAGLAALAVAFVWLLRRERALDSRRLVRAELLGLAGGVLALVVMAAVSSSGFTDAGGPADWVLIALVYGIGFVITTVLVYTVAGWLWPRSRAGQRQPA